MPKVIIIQKKYSQNTNYIFRSKTLIKNTEYHLEKKNSRTVIIFSFTAIIYSYNL